MARGATRGRQDVQIGLQIAGLVQGSRQLDNQQTQIGIAQKHLTQAEQAEQNAHARWYFALPAHKQAEYDLRVAQYELQQARTARIPLEAAAAILERPKSKVFNLVWVSVLSLVGLLSAIGQAVDGNGGAGVPMLVVLLGIAAIVYFVAPRRRREKAARARAVVTEADRRIASIQGRIADLAPRAVDPATR